MRRIIAWGFTALVSGMLALAHPGAAVAAEGSDASDTSAALAAGWSVVKNYNSANRYMSTTDLSGAKGAHADQWSLVYSPISGALAPAQQWQLVSAGGEW